MGLTDLMLKLGVAQWDPEPKPSREDWPPSREDKVPEVMKPKR